MSLINWAALSCAGLRSLGQDTKTGIFIRSTSMVALPSPIYRSSLHRLEALSHIAGMLNRTIFLILAMFRKKISQNPRNPRGGTLPRRRRPRHETPPSRPLRLRADPQAAGL